MNAAPIAEPALRMSPPSPRSDGATNGEAPAPADKRRVYKTIDAWRAVAALWVLFCHATEGALKEAPILRAQPAYAFCAYGYLGVELFFVISGYCIAAAVASAADRGGAGLTVRFFRARIRRIFPPYWAALALLLALGYSLRWAAAHHLAPQAALQNPLVTIATAHQGGGAWFYLTNAALLQAAAGQPFLYFLSWTLCYEVAFYALCGLALVLFGKRAGARGVLNALHVVTALCGLGLALRPYVLPFPLDMWVVFGLGVAVFDWLTYSGMGAERAVGSKRGLLGTALGSAIAFAVGSFGLAAAAYGRGVGTGVTLGIAHHAASLVFWASVPFALLLVLLHRYDEPLARIRAVAALGAVGVFSYSLYLTHILSISLTRGALAASGWADGYEGAKLAVVTLIAVAVAFGFFWLCERPFLSSAAKPRRRIGPVSRE